MSFQLKKDIISLRCGVIRCVGACFTCAGVMELALRYTAAVLFSIMIIQYEVSYIKRNSHQDLNEDFVQFYEVTYTLDDLTRIRYSYCVGDKCQPMRGEKDYGEFRSIKTCGEKI